MRVVVGPANEDERCIAWARAFFEAAAPFALGSMYVNFLTQDETERESVQPIYATGFLFIAGCTAMIKTISCNRSRERYA